VEPDEAALRADLAAVAFQLGVRRSKWRVGRLHFPWLDLFVGAPVRANGPDEYLFRLNCEGYRAIAPTGQLWHGLGNRPYSPEERPKNRDGGILIAFSTWGHCLYHPIDRIGRTHWPDQHADLAWGPGDDISTFAETIHAILDDPNYVGAVVSPGAFDLPSETLEQAAA
jgi:hypothetical protein